MEGAVLLHPEPAPSLPLHQHTVVFGGSFDPPHMGHQMACLYLLEALGAREVLVVPTGQHAFGKTLSPLAQRLALCQAMAAPLGSQVRVSPIEGETCGPSLTVDTLAALRAAHPEVSQWAFTLGADLLADFPRWHRFAELIALARPVVLGRHGYPLEPIGVRELLGPSAVLAPLVLPEVSSSDIRRKMAGGEPLTGLVPQGVAKLLLGVAPGEAR